MSSAVDDSPTRRELFDSARLALRLTWRGSRAALLAHLAVTLVEGAAPVALAWLTKLVLDRVAADTADRSVFALVGALAVVGVCAAVLPQLTEYLRAEIGRRVSLLAVDRLYAAVERFVGLGRFEDPRFLDRLRLAEQGGQSCSGLVDTAMRTGRGLTTLVGLVGSLAVLSPGMTAIVLAAAVPTLIAEVALSRRRARMLTEIGPVERREFFYSRLLGGVDAAKEIRLFGTGPFLRARMVADRREADGARRRMDRRESLLQSSLGLLGAVVAGAGLIWAVTAALAGRMSVGDIAMFVAAMAGVQGALGTVIVEVAQLHHRMVVFDHYRHVVGSGTDLPVAVSPSPARPLRDGIEFRDVWFRYSEDHPWILRGVNLRIPAGAAVALVGHNGAGKSTLVKLMCRFYDPTRGSIRWDGVDLRDLAPAEFRRRVSATFQDYVHYDMSATENIALGDLSALDKPERVRSAALLAGIDDTLAALPAGYATLLSRMFLSEADKADPTTGVVLSGGQWQRLALARAFVRDTPDLLILDEPSAGLDAEAEAEIHDSLRRYRAGRTSLLISHRLGALRDADLIVVLADGRIAERGRHAELLAVSGVYARLFELQAAGYQSDERRGPPVEVVSG